MCHLCIRVIRAPSGSQALLATQVPDEKVNVPKHHLLHIGADSGRCLDHLVHQELVQDGRLASIIQTHHHDFVFWEEIVWEQATCWSYTLTLIVVVRDIIYSTQPTHSPSLPNRLHSLENISPMVCSVALRSVPYSIRFYNSCKVGIRIGRGISLESGSFKFVIEIEWVPWNSYKFAYFAIEHYNRNLPSPSTRNHHSGNTKLVYRRQNQRINEYQRNYRKWFVCCHNLCASSMELMVLHPKTFGANNCAPLMQNKCCSVCVHLLQCSISDPCIWNKIKGSITALQRTLTRTI